MSDSWTAIVVTALFLSEQWWSSIRIFFGRRAPNFAQRADPSDMWYSLSRQLVLVAWFTWLFVSGTVHPFEVRLRLDKPVGAIAQGALAWVLLTVGVVLLQRLKVAKVEIREYVGTERMMWTRGRFGRVLMRIVLCLNPITEELAARGVLVILVHQVTGSLPLALVTGLISCWLTHLYQGLRSIPGHTIVYFGLVGLAYAQYGLLAAISCHFLGDMISFIGKGGRMKWIREERIRRRQVASHPA